MRWSCATLSVSRSAPELPSSTMNKITETLVCAAVLLALLGGSFATGRLTKKPQIIESRDTTILTQIVKDTIIEVRFKEKIIVRHDTCVLARVDSVFCQQPDSAAVVIPIEERVFTGENYRAVVQGYKPQLTSIDIYQKTIVVESVKKDASRWSFGVNVGAQAGFYYTLHGWSPGVGIGASVGLQYRF